MGRDYLEEFPEVQDYMNDKTNYVANDPVLYKYYGSFQTIESYWESNLRSELEKKHGDDIFQIEADYKDSGESGSKEREQWRKENPDEYARLKELWNDSYSIETRDNVNDAIDRMFERLPEGPEVTYRGEPTGAMQEAIVGALQPNVQPEDVYASIPSDLKELVKDYWLNGEDLPDAAYETLGEIGDEYGISTNTLLQMAGTQIR